MNKILKIRFEFLLNGDHQVKITHKNIVRAFNLDLCEKSELGYQKND